MAERAPRLLPLGIGLAVGGLALVLAVARMPYGAELAAAALALAVLGSLAYSPGTSIPPGCSTAGIIGSTFNSNWGALGVPGGLPPDRFILLAGILGLPYFARGRTGPPGRSGCGRIHGLLALTLAWAIGSGLAAQTLEQLDRPVLLLDRMAVPFAVFALAPLAFNTHASGRAS